MAVNKICYTRLKLKYARNGIFRGNLVIPLIFIYFNAFPQVKNDSSAIERVDEHHRSGCADNNWDSDLGQPWNYC